MPTTRPIPEESDLTPYVRGGSQWTTTLTRCPADDHERSSLAERCRSPTPSRKLAGRSGPYGVTRVVQDAARSVAHQYINFSNGQHAADGTWASGPTPDGKGEFTYVAEPPDGVPMPQPTHPDSRLYGTTELPNTVEKAAGKAQDALNKE